MSHPLDGLFVGLFPLSGHPVYDTSAIDLDPLGGLVKSVAWLLGFRFRLNDIKIGTTVSVPDTLWTALQATRGP
jgi:hypothetical protein